MITGCVLLLGLSVVSVLADSMDILIQAEDMLGATSEVNPRSHASGHKSVHLYSGEKIQTELCFIHDTKFSLDEISYSNDGPSDRIRITLDKLILDEFETVFSDDGAGWDTFRSHESQVSTVTEGRHILTVTVLESDKNGVEIDFIKLSVNHSQGVSSLRCRSFCFEDITYPYKQGVSPAGGARAVQRSVQTKCAEEDNVNIPIFYKNASTLNFVVTASLPKYRSFQNNRDPDWTDCKMSDAFWRYRNIDFSRDHKRQSGRSSIHITQVTQEVSGRMHLGVIEADFELEGPSTGLTDSELGAHIHLKDILYNGPLVFQFQYYNRYNLWSAKQEIIVKNTEKNIKFITPDFSFREGKGNKIRIEIYTEQKSTPYLSIGDFHMYKRPLKPDMSTTLYKDGFTVIDGVKIDMWWRINETMSVTIKGEEQSFNDIHYFRIHQRVPWTVDGFSEVFVLYQDANIRLLPSTPHGLDYIPFGSSVIIGQTNPQSNRPCAPISHLDIDPDILKMTIFFMDSNFVSMSIQTTMSETQLHVSETHFMKDVNLYPFFTFRSMYVADDNNDVDHISADDGKPRKIIEQWNELRGNFFAFYRQCISKHNTQSPDISILIMSLS